ncbi:MAG: hypothetical protein AUK47_20575 [Deltaproteobacteria bacterium CG2_30_63_29]|nr:MAG: hypothetical protein AUK47_20575 [Deltaproteobacteria bacterium CG2_30_63_29]PJB33300.1 MAG: hypothetical protein CO108_31200 [Deltaproteobacteria bacterium CG_4_9_14_3_um_filter_63_12]
MDARNAVPLHCSVLMSELMASNGPALLLPGTLLDGRYEILEFVGEGGFATVYKAKQVRINRIVAIKVLNVDSNTVEVASFQERFIREAQTAAKINHPNVVTIHDYGFAAEIHMPFIVMELLEGHDLDMELGEYGPLSPKVAVELFIPCLEALGRGHEVGIIHRDLKPENLFYSKPRTDEASLVVLDFGVARIEQTDQKRLTTDGQIFGTPVFAAPEWIKHQLALPTMDVYAMGLILIEAITGVQVVNGESAFEILTAHCAGDLTVPDSVMDSPLGPVLCRALALNHEERFADAYALREALLKIDLDALPEIMEAEPSRRFRQPGAVSTETPLFQAQTAGAVKTTAPDSSRKRKYGPPVLASAIVVLLVLAAVWFFGREPAAEVGAGEPSSAPQEVGKGATGVTTPRVENPDFEAPSEPTLPEDEGTEELTVADPAAAAAKEAEIAGLRASLPAGAIGVLIESRPSGAKVTANGHLLGLTPYLHVFESASAPEYEFRIRYSGFKSERRAVSPADAPKVFVKLKKKAKNAAADPDDDDDSKLFILP